MISINGKYYKIDMDSVMAWVTETPSTERSIGTITTLTYQSVDDNGELVEKEVSESKNSLNEALNNVRYDFVRILINTIFTVYSNSINEMVTVSFDDLSFGQKIAFNTLLDKGIIKEVTNYDND